jgi:hypothetical protein
MKLIIGLMAFFALNLAFSSERCDLRFTQTSVCANIDWIYGPYLDQYNSAKISISENNTIGSLKVIPWMVMNSHEHGSRPVVLTKTGRSRISNRKSLLYGWYARPMVF